MPESQIRDGHMDNDGLYEEQKRQPPILQMSPARNHCKAHGNKPFSDHVHGNKARILAAQEKF